MQDGDGCRLDGNGKVASDPARPIWLNGACSFLTYEDSEMLRKEQAVRLKVANNEEICSKYIFVSQCYFPLVRMALAALKVDQSDVKKDIFHYKRAGAITEILVASDQADQPMVIMAKGGFGSIECLPAENYKIGKYIDKVPDMKGIPYPGAAKRMKSSVVISPDVTQEKTNELRTLMENLGRSTQEIDSMFIGTMPITLEEHELKGCFLEDEEMIVYLSYPESAQQLELEKWSSVFESVIKENPDWLEEREVENGPRGKRSLYCKYCNCMATWQHLATERCKRLKCQALAKAKEEALPQPRRASPLLKLILAAVTGSKGTTAQHDNELTNPNVLDDRNNFGKRDALKEPFYIDPRVWLPFPPGQGQVEHHPTEFQEQQQNGDGDEKWSQHLSGFRSSVVPECYFYNVPYAALLQLKMELARYIEAVIAKISTPGKMAIWVSDVLPYEITGSLPLDQIARLHTEVAEFLYCRICNW